MSISRHAAEGDVFIWDRFALGCVSMVLVGMGRHSLTAFSERLVWPPGSPEITPMPEGTQRTCYIWIAAERREEHMVNLSPLLPINRVQPTHCWGYLKQVHRRQQQQQQEQEKTGLL